MWKHGAKDEETKLKKDIEKLRIDWCELNGKIIDDNLFPQTSDYEKVTLNPCPDCNQNKERVNYISQGERFDGSSFGIYYYWCENCGKAFKKAYDEY